MSIYTIRPTNSEKAPFRVNLTTTSLLSLKLRPGDLCTFHSSGDSDTIKGVAIAWENSGNGMKDSIVQTSKLFQELNGLRLGDKVTVKPSGEKLVDANTVILKCEHDLSEQEQNKLSLFASSIVPSKHDVLAPGQTVSVVVGDIKEDFKVVDVGGPPLGRITKSTSFMFGSTEQSQIKPPSLQFDLSGVGGLQHQVREIKKFLQVVTSGSIFQAYPRLQGRQGLLLYGPSGVGKTLLGNCIATSEWSQVLHWEGGNRDVLLKGHTLVVIDFDAIACEQDTIRGIQKLFKSILGTTTVVLGLIRHPNDLSEKLRNYDTFAVELELPVPDAGQRFDIVKIIRGAATVPTDEMLSQIAQRTHGYVGADLKKMMGHIVSNAFHRQEMDERSLKLSVNGIDEASRDAVTNTTFEILQADIEEALAMIRPSALKEILFQKPDIHWSDIGGQTEIKRKLQNAVDMPLTRPERMKRLGLEPKKGVLLYGPPGCSKTLLVKALATECDLNFLSVKGAELISMYVGESERATREIFAKARQARPSIIFFDEIDAIATRAKHGSQLNVLTTLLTELDGFDKMSNVFVIGATNKPQEIDPALMRPGRFDNVIYVGPPDLETRRDIFQRRLAKVEAEEDVGKSASMLAERTEGFSGAEVVAVCQLAGEYADEAGRDYIKLEDDLVRAIENTPRNISKEMLEEYSSWNEQRKL